MPARPPLEPAIAAHRRGDLASAEQGYRRRLKEAPDDTDALHLLGCIELSRGNRVKAIELIERAIRLKPGVALYHDNLAEAWHRSGDRAKATTESRLAFRLDPKSHRAHNRLGVMALEAGEYPDAMASFSEALKLKPADPEVLVNIASLMIRLGDFDGAVQASEVALRGAPRSPLAWNNLGMARRGLGQLAEAKKAFQQAGPLPLARFNLGYLAMFEGDLATALPLLEARRDVKPLGIGLAGREWDGRPSPGKRLLVLMEQGMGDAILFSRFFPALRERFESVVVQVPEPVVRLIAGIDPAIEVVTDLSETTWDLWTPLMSVPLRLGVRSVDELPREAWLKATPGPRLHGKFRAGINWAGNPRFTFDRIRSTTLDQLEPLLKIPGIEWVSLHKGEREEEARARRLPAPLESATDFHDTARVIAGFDLVISTETAVPNLSGALGVPTIVLAAVDHDWRWHGWFPDVTVCAQPTPGDWAGAVERAVAEIGERVAWGNPRESLRAAA